MSSFANPRRSLAVLARASTLVMLLTGCTKEGDKITVQNLIEEPANQAPVIVDQGPDVPAGGLELVGPYIGHDLWALVGDPNGLDDISLVTVDVDSVRLVRFILRPDTSTSFCTQFSYAPNETVSTQLILPVPRTFPGFEFMPLSHTQGGLYTAVGFGGPGFGFPDLLAAATNVHEWPGGCGGTGGLLFPWVVEPPVVPSPTAAIVTLVEVEYLGISVTVFDKVGAKATAAFPDWHLTFMTQEEKSAPP